MPPSTLTLNVLFTRCQNVWLARPAKDKVVRCDKKISTLKEFKAFQESLNAYLNKVSSNTCVPTSIPPQKDDGAVIKLESELDYMFLEIGIGEDIWTTEYRFEYASNTWTWCIHDCFDDCFVSKEKVSESLGVFFAPWIKSLEEQAKLKYFLHMYKTKATDERHCLVDLFRFMWFGTSTKS